MCINLWISHFHPTQVPSPPALPINRTKFRQPCVPENHLRGLLAIASRKACASVAAAGFRTRPFKVIRPIARLKTGLVTGSTFGETVGGYGIEIDTTTADSPPGTTVLARIPDLFGPGLSGEMTYYETAAGARVFSAGVLDFGGSATFWPMTRMLENLWRHMLADVVPPPADGATPASRR